MATVKVKDKELLIDFEPAMQGFRMNAYLWRDDDFQKLDCSGLQIGLTKFESLCNVASEVFDEAVSGEALAEQLDVATEFADDTECFRCGYITDYQDMHYIGVDHYECYECKEED